MHNATLQHLHLLRDAQEAARRRDGYEFGGSRLRVEVAKGGNETQGAPRGAPFRAPRGATGYRLLIKGLPKSASWQDVKVRVCMYCRKRHRTWSRSVSQWIWPVKWEVGDMLK